MVKKALDGIEEFEKIFEEEIKSGEFVKETLDGVNNLGQYYSIFSIPYNLKSSTFCSEWIRRIPPNMHYFISAMGDGHIWIFIYRRWDRYIYI